MANELKLFSELLMHIFRSHQRPGDYMDAEARAIYDAIVGVYVPFSKPEEIEALGPSPNQPTCDFSATGRFLYLNPSERPPVFVPVVSLRCDFERSEPELRLQVALFLRKGDAICAIGLRFESPEGEGVHHYYHAQFINAFHHGPSLQGAPSWLPTKQPAFPVDADSPVKLLLALVTSLYGLDYVWRLVLEFDSSLQAHLNDVSYTSFTPNYWLVQTPTGGHKYKTWGTRDRVRMTTLGRHGKCTIKPINRDAYNAEDGCLRHIL